MNNTEFAEATGYLRAMESKILTSAVLDRVIDTETVDEALRMLTQNSELDFSTIARADDYETVLNAELKRVYNLLFELCPKREIVDVLASKYDFHNIKVAIKANALNQNSLNQNSLKQDYNDLYMTITEIEPKLIVECINGNDTKDLPLHIINAAEVAFSLFSETNDPQLIDLQVDKSMFEYILQLCETIDNEFITNYVKAQIDFYNAKTLLRVRNMEKGAKFLENALIDGGTTDKTLFVENYDKPASAIPESFAYNYFDKIIRETIESFEKTGTYSEAERLCDNYLLEQIKETKMVAYGPETLFAYVVAKENEIKQVRILVTCKVNNISNEVLKERLRDNYA